MCVFWGEVFFEWKWIFTVFKPSNSEHSKEKKKHKKRKKSRSNAKVSDKVKDPQRWRQAHLQYEFVNKQVKFDHLDFKLFLAGEISIIAADDLSESEKKGR